MPEEHGLLFQFESFDQSLVVFDLFLVAPPGRAVRGYFPQQLLHNRYALFIVADASSRYTFGWSGLSGPHAPFMFAVNVYGDNAGIIAFVINGINRRIIQPFQNPFQRCFDPDIRKLERYLFSLQIFWKPEIKPRSFTKPLQNTTQIGIRSVQAQQTIVHTQLKRRTVNQIPMGKSAYHQKKTQ